MLPRVLIDTTTVPGGGALKLFQRGDEFSIMLGANELMNSRLSGSEEALASLSLARLETSAPRVLIGGLGMGFTLRAVLSQAAPHAQIVVAEIAPALIDWARGPMASLFAGCLDDPRVSLFVGDVGVAIARGGWDAILLDVDNGPDGLSRPDNDRLYSARGLSIAFRALQPGGVLAVWSSAPDARFTQRLRTARFAVEETRPRAGRGRGARHVIWLARKPS